MTGFEPIVLRKNWERSTDRDWAKVLATLPLFSRLGRRQLRKLAREAEFKEFAPGETVIATGAPADSFYVILGGRATVRGKPGARTLELGDHFGEIALLNGKPRSATVLASEDLHVMRVPKQTFLDLVQNEAGVAHAIVRELGARVRRTEIAAGLAR
jgi:CRP/FNR family cyclic AMP-dependent transcriptional regulator